MSLEEKIGQLFLVYFEGSELSPPLREQIVDRHVGGLIFYSIAGNIVSPSQVGELVNQAQSLAKIPLFISIDQEGGSVVRLSKGVTSFPSNMAVAATGSVDLAFQMAACLGKELKALGINWNYAPVLDVNNNPANPIIGIRSFGSDPNRVSEFGKAMLAGYAEAGILSCPKHFPGHGDTDIDSHSGLPVIAHPLERFEQIEFPPFRTAIEAGADAIMTAHVVLPALGSEPATLSPSILEDILRKRWGYEGLIITDSLTMGALEKGYGGIAQVAEQALKAGADILLFGADWGHTSAEYRIAYDHVLMMAKTGQIPLQRIETSVRRILQVKAKYGILSPQSVDLSQISRWVDTPDHQDVARQIVRESITVVRSTSLPIQSKLLVVWPESSQNLGSFLPNAEPLSIGLDPDPEETAQILAKAQDFDQVIIGSDNANHHPRLVELISALPPQKTCVVALGSPYDLLHFPEVATYIVTYGLHPATLPYLAQILSGDLDAKGILPITLDTRVFPISVKGL